MADGDAGIGSVVTDPDVSMGASDGASPATADLDAANSGALSAEVAEKLNKRMDDMRSQMDREREAAATRESKLLEALTAQTGSDTGREQEAIQKARDELEARFDAGELTGKEFIGLMDGIASDTTAQLERQYGDKMTAAEARLQELQAKIDANSSALDPAYVARKEQVDAIQVEMGVDRDLALKIAAKLEPTQPPRQAIPGSTGTGVRVDAQPSGNISDAEFAMIESVTGKALTADQRAELNRKGGE